MGTLTSPTTAFRDHLVALVDVIEDHCGDLDVIHADAALTDVHVALASRDDALILADRLHATPAGDYDPHGRVWYGATPSGVRVQISDWSQR